MAADHTKTRALRDQAVAWFFKLRAPDCKPADREAFACWCRQSAAHEQAYAEVQDAWTRLGALHQFDFPERRAALGYRPTYLGIETLIGAVSLLVLAVSWTTASGPNGWIGTGRTEQTARGSSEIAILSDGSRIELDADTKLRIVESRWSRKVELTRGRAFFTVMHDAKRPFQVAAGAGRIEDLGTAFEVRVDPSRTSVAVAEGKVHIVANTERELTGGQGLSYDGRGSLGSAIDAPLELLAPWRHKQMVFRAERLEDVLHELSRYHAVRLGVDDPGLGNLRVSGTFRTDNLSAALNAIALILPVKIIHQDEKSVLLVAQAR